jgi:hypothetical protein
MLSYVCRRLLVSPCRHVVSMPIVSSMRFIADPATQVLLWPSPKEFVFRFRTPFLSLTAP